jgi:hypothetical protein
VLDYNLLPAPPQQRAFVAAYLSALLGGLGLGPPPAGGAWCAEGKPAAPATDGSSDGWQRRAAGGPRSVWQWLARHGVQRGAADSARDAAAAGSLRATNGSISRGSSSTACQMPEAAWRSLFLELLAAARGYVRVSHLVWALWGLILARDCSVEFDYLDYSQQRWAQFRMAAPAHPAAAGGRGAHAVAKAAAAAVAEMPGSL